MKITFYFYLSCFNCKMFTSGRQHTTQCKRHTAQCIARTVHAPTNAPATAPVQFILYIEHCKSNTLHLYYILHIFHFTVQKKLNLPEWHSKFIGRMNPNISDRLFPIERTSHISNSYKLGPVDNRPSTL